MGDMATFAFKYYQDVLNEIPEAGEKWETPFLDDIAYEADVNHDGALTPAFSTTTHGTASGETSSSGMSKPAIVTRSERHHELTGSCGQNGLTSPGSEKANSPIYYHSASFVGMPIELRLMIYSYLPLPYHEMIHLTFTPKSHPTKDKPTKIHLSTELLSLFLTCQMVNLELTDVIYGYNTFVLMPGNQNYYAPTMPKRISSSEMWLSYLTIDVCAAVMQLDVYLDLDMLSTVEDIAEGLSVFPSVNITVLAPFTVKESLHKKRLAKLTKICKEIHAARGYCNTVWYDGDDAEISLLLDEVMLAAPQRERLMLHNAW